METQQVPQMEPQQTQTSVLPPSVDQLVAEAIGQLPQLASQTEALRKVMTVLATYVGAGNIPVVSVDRETALTELELMQGWMANDIEVACEEVMEGVGEALAELQTEFEAKSGTAVEGTDFEVFSRRFLDERQEQAGLASRANQLLEAVKVISGQTGIPNPDPGLQPAVQAPVEKRESLLNRVGFALAAGGRVVASPFLAIPTPPAIKPEKSEPLLSWQTPPVLVETDRDLKLIARVQSRLAAQPDVQLVVRALENLGLGRDALTELLARVAGKAREQLAQSQKVLTTAAADHSQFTAKAEVIQGMRDIVLRVHNFFFPEKTQVQG